MCYDMIASQYVIIHRLCSVKAISGEFHQTIHLKFWVNSPDQWVNFTSTRLYSPWHLVISQGELYPASDRIHLGVISMHGHVQNKICCQPELNPQPFEGNLKPPD
jgi:hypothetical protein